jgi:hypothetical protein
MVISTPLAAPGDDRQHRRSRRGHPHIVLELRHMLFGGGFFRKIPGQHELGLEYGPRGLNPAVQGRRHPAVYRVKHLPLHLGDDLPGVLLVPVPVQLLGHAAELNQQVAG